jgi:hypothetical protein
MNSQDNIRKAIKEINLDESLSRNDKIMEIQKLMYNKDNTKNKENNLNDCEQNKPCPHYLSKLCKSFYFSCCNVFYNCVRCHNEVETHESSPEAIKCEVCEFIQPASNECMNKECNTQFDISYCKECFLWTDKDIYHCHECGICRVGTKETLFHCNKCDMCFNVSSELNSDNHICANVTYRDKICSYCMDNIYTSQDSALPLRCGHIVHQVCMNNAIQSREYRCAICRKSMYTVDWSLLKSLISIQPMPIEDIKVGDIVKCNVMNNREVKIINIRNINDSENNENIDILYEVIFTEMPYIKGIFNSDSLSKSAKKIELYCNDCDTKSNVEFHYLGNECKKCGSFNTI